MKKPREVELVITKLVHGGQGMGTLEDGRKAFIWGALPNERVRVTLTRQKKDYVEGVANEILEASPNRINPKESIFLATSPWQNMTLEAEHQAMKEIVYEVYAREKISLPDFDVVSDGNEFAYRNKIEFSFYGDDAGLHYAFYNRGTHRKQIVEDSALALTSINTAATALLEELNNKSVRAGDLKSVILRTTQEGKVVAALFVKPTEFTTLVLPQSLAGLKIYHSNPKSPASVKTQLLHEIGNTTLQDNLLGSTLEYDVTGFFQVNLPVFVLALKRIADFTKDLAHKIDMYAGVGSIGIPIGGTEVLVELDEANVDMATNNARGKDIRVVQSSSEQALDYIKSDCCLIVDPPRSGLHKDVVDRILSQLPARVCYLSCNPATQARDVAMLSSAYSISFFECYNFFPRTPHIETLILLEKK